MTTPQAPIGSGFGARTTAQEVLGGRSLDGVVAIVTGGYSGLGLETTRVLAGAGATVVVPARDAKKAQEALSDVRGKVEQAELDLADPASIDRFAAEFLASGRPLPLLINNAGVSACPLTRDARGYEVQFATNHLGHFQLTARLWPALVRADGARVVMVSSAGHKFTPVSLDDPNFERSPYDKWKGYGRSKTANVLFAVALDARGRDVGVRAFALHPGGILTDLGRHLSREELMAIEALDEQGRPHERLKSLAQGAATQVWCATSPQLDGMGGVYCEDCDIAEAVAEDSAGFDGVRPWAIDRQAADDLWTLSEKMTGVKFAIPAAARDLI